MVDAVLEQNLNANPISDGTPEVDCKEILTYLIERMFIWWVWLPCKWMHLLLIR